MAFDALAIAHYFLDKARPESKLITPLALQKLVYFAHGWHLALLGQPLINQRVEAWDYGPVIHDIFGEFREFGRSPITRKAIRVDSPGFGKVNWCDLRFEEPKLEADEATKKLLDRVWDVYKKFSGIQLSNLTHAAGSPWEQTRRENPKLHNAVISDELIKDYFVAEAEKNAAPKRGQP